MTVSYTPKVGLTLAAKGDLRGTWIDAWNQDRNRVEARLACTYAGNPNNNVEGFWLGQQCYDSTNKVLYFCTTVGPASGVGKAVWQTHTELAASSIASVGIKVSANDTTPNTLEAKLLAGSSLSLSTQNDGANETRTLANRANFLKLSRRQFDQPFTVATTNSLTFGILGYVDPNGVYFEQTEALTKTFASWAVGNNQGMLDAGVVAPSTMYYLYAIRRTDSTTQDILMSLNSASPTLPSGYSVSSRLGSVLLDSSSQVSKYFIEAVTLAAAGTPRGSISAEFDASNNMTGWHFRVGSGPGVAGSNVKIDSSGNIKASGNVTAYSGE